MAQTTTDPTLGRSPGQPFSQPNVHDPALEREWIDSLDALTVARGPQDAARILDSVGRRAASLHLPVRDPLTTDFVNTIAHADQPPFPGDLAIEERIRHYIRWNAAVIVSRANHRHDGIGGHLASYASAATLYEVGFNHFFRGKTHDVIGDQVYFQGHSAPGFYARAFLEGRLDEAELDRFRQEVDGGGLPSYPHPRRTDFWEFPTVSMGIGPLTAAYQARYNRYLHDRGILDTSASRVWCFVGDGEMDEPESVAAVAFAGRERLDNLTFVVNCNLQRLDGPVRGNGKIIQELEGLYRGAGWNVIKVVWGSTWDDLLDGDHDGALVGVMNATLDGQFQKYRVETGAYIREHFFGGHPAAARLVADRSDDELRRLRRGGHDPVKVYAAYHAATTHRGQPTVVLAHTVKGWSLGSSFEARNATHQMKKMSEDELRVFRDRLDLPISDRELDAGPPPFVRLPKGSAEQQYLLARRHELGGPQPARIVRRRPPLQPSTAPFDELIGGTPPAVTTSSTSAFTRLLRGLMADPQIGQRIVPIIPDEARTFGIDALFRRHKIYAAGGQRYEPVDAALMLSYTEGADGQILEEGITEAGSMASFIAAATSYATLGEPVIPFFVFYSMFGFHRLGDLVWALGDMRGRGFLMAATAGRTTLQGEGLQHTDGYSHLWASTVPNCLAYDPAFAYELAVIVDDGIRRMYGPEPEDLMYYITIYNEPIHMPAMPDGVRDGILRGLYRSQPAPAGGTHRARLVASGSAMAAALEAQQILADYDVAAEVWSATSYKALRDDAMSCERWNRLHPTEPPRQPYVTSMLGDAKGGPIVATSDFVKAVPDLIARWVHHQFVPLGTDGFGLSDTREALRRHFEVNAAHIVIATLHQLSLGGQVAADVVQTAIDRFAVDADAVDPLHA